MIDWYVLPAEGPAARLADGTVMPPETLKWVNPPPAGSELIIQTIPARLLQPDTEYFAWFLFKGDAPAPMTCAINVTVPLTSANAAIECLGLTVRTRDNP